MSESKLKQNMQDNWQRVEEIGRDLGRDAAAKGRDLWLAGLGAVAMADEAGREVFDHLVDRGEQRARRERSKVEARVEQAGKQAKSLRNMVERGVEERASAALKRFGVPTRDEVQALIQRIEQLTRKVETLS